MNKVSWRFCRSSDCYCVLGLTGDEGKGVQRCDPALNQAWTCSPSTCADIKQSRNLTPPAYIDLHSLVTPFEEP